MVRPRHPRKELEAIIRSLEKQGWRVERGRKYYVAKCPCSDQHLKTVHLTPSGRHYARNLRHRLATMTCWQEES